MQFGVVLMAAAVTLGLVEVPNDHEKRALLTSRPVFEMATVNSEQGNNPLRREREESAPHYISYGVNQRTPSRTGKI